jgi:hypothetical protein
VAKVARLGATARDFVGISEGEAVFSEDSKMVRPTGLEPVRCYSLEPESSASANSATGARGWDDRNSLTQPVELRGFGLALPRTHPSRSSDPNHSTRAAESANDRQISVHLYLGNSPKVHHHRRPTSPQDPLKERGTFPPSSAQITTPRRDQWPPGGGPGLWVNASKEGRGSPSGLSGLSPG